MARSRGGRSKGRSRAGERGAGSRVRWLIAAGALIVAVVAVYVLAVDGLVTTGDETPLDAPRRPLAVERSGRDGPALDEIDAQSRARMRELLKEAGEDGDER